MTSGTLSGVETRSCVREVRGVCGLLLCVIVIEVHSAGFGEWKGGRQVVRETIRKRGLLCDPCHRHRSTMDEANADGEESKDTEPQRPGVVRRRSLSTPTRRRNTSGASKKEEGHGGGKKKERYTRVHFAVLNNDMEALKKCIEVRCAWRMFRSLSRYRPCVPVILNRCRAGGTLIASRG